MMRLVSSSLLSRLSPGLVLLHHDSKLAIILRNGSVGIAITGSVDLHAGEGHFGSVLVMLLHNSSRHSAAANTDHC